MLPKMTLLIQMVIDRLRHQKGLEARGAELIQDRPPSPLLTFWLNVLFPRTVPLILVRILLS